MDVITHAVLPVFAGYCEMTRVTRPQDKVSKIPGDTQRFLDHVPGYHHRDLMAAAAVMPAATGSRVCSA